MFLPKKSLSIWKILNHPRVILLFSEFDWFMFALVVLYKKDYRTDDMLWLSDMFFDRFFLFSNIRNRF